MATILTKKSDTSSSVPLAADLTNAAGGAELAVNTADKRLYSKTSGGSVVELGTNPSALSLPNGTTNGIPYLNGSKVLTSGSALTFDGSNFVVNPANAQFYVGSSFAKIENKAGASASFVMADTSDSATIKNVGSSIAFINSATEAMRLTSTGLGIGTSSPVSRLHVVSSGNPTITVSGTDGAYTSILSLVAAGGGSSKISATGGSNILVLATNGTDRATLDTSGNLGLGVTPSAWASGLISLDLRSEGFISGGGNYLSILSNVYFNSGARYKTTGFAATEYLSQGGAHIWRTAPSGTAGNAISFTQAMTLDASGNLLVGTTGSNPIGGRYNGVVLGSGGSIDIRHTSNTSDWGISSTSGNIVNFYSDNGSAAVYAGSISVNGGVTTYGSVSDYRAKIVIGAVSDSGDRIDLLEPIEYAWKSNGERTRGFLAHKFQEVYPQSVSGNKDATDKNGKPVYQSMQASTPELIADLVAEIQSLRKRLAALESK